MRKILFLIVVFNLSCCCFLPFDSTKPKWGRDYCEWFKNNHSPEDLKNEKNKICNSQNNEKK